ncbi:MAG: zinc ABC transporter substrate-binding protein [Atopostipes sp.]|nr:zinc ABC transporter substrate-binding protein [Atopostipes sp.]
MKKKDLGWFVLSFFLVLFISSCSHKETDVINSDKAQVVTSIFPVYEIVREVAGEQAEVHLMVGPGEDAHHYEPSAKDITMINESDTFIYSSNEMEFWASDTLKVVENENLSIIQLADEIDLEIKEDTTVQKEKKHDHSHHHKGMDPHFWLDPLAISKEVPIITKVLSEIDPTNKDQYETNGENFISQLKKLHNDYEESFDGAKNRNFVVQHKAFGHLANRYDLKQFSVGGLSTEVEPNPRDLINIIDFVRENNIKVIFYQSGNTSAIAETIAKETGAESTVLYDLENKPEEIEADENYYIETMYHNLEELKKAIH